jgi:hypothetical protein
MGQEHLMSSEGDRRHRQDGMVTCYSLAMVIAVAGFLATCVPAASVHRTDVSLRVRFTLTDLDYRPVAGAPVRVVFGSDPHWQRQSSGHRFVTDAKGEHRFETRVSLDQRRRKLPTNFVNSLLSGSQRTDHLLVGAELEYATFQWLYTVDVYRFPSGSDVLLDGESIYTRDARGDFTRKASYDGDGWHVADLGNLVLTSPGHQAWNFMLQPDPSNPTGTLWTLDVAFKRSPPPVRR